MTMAFVPRRITSEMAEQGYNNEGRGQLIGYEAAPKKHEQTCRYRVATNGDPDKWPHDPCSCRLGLWQEAVTSTQRVVNEMRKTAKRTTKRLAKRKAKTKTKKSPSQK